MNTYTPLSEVSTFVELRERVDKLEKAVNQLRGMMFKKK